MSEFAIQRFKRFLTFIDAREGGAVGTVVAMILEVIYSQLLYPPAFATKFNKLKNAVPTLTSRGRITPSPDYNIYLGRAIKISIWLQKCPRICGQPAKSIVKSK